MTLKNIVGGDLEIGYNNNVENTFGKKINQI
jgi:hypothetical protein